MFLSDSLIEHGLTHLYTYGQILDLSHLKSLCQDLFV